jgi:hypothetical protein
MEVQLALRALDLYRRQLGVSLEDEALDGVPQRRLAEFCRSRDVTLIDPLPDFRPGRPGTIVFAQARHHFRSGPSLRRGASSFGQRDISLAGESTPAAAGIVRQDGSARVGQAIASRPLRKAARARHLDRANASAFEELVQQPRVTTIKEVGQLEPISCHGRFPISIVSAETIKLATTGKNSCLKGSKLH